MDNKKTYPVIMIGDVVINYNTPDNRFSSFYNISKERANEIMKGMEQIAKDSTVKVGNQAHSEEFDALMYLGNSQKLAKDMPELIMITGKAHEVLEGRRAAGKKSHFIHTILQLAQQTL